MKIKISSAASQDLIDGYWFYGKQSEGVGSFFRDSLYSDIESLVITADTLLCALRAAEPSAPLVTSGLLRYHANGQVSVKVTGKKYCLYQLLVIIYLIHIMIYVVLLTAFY